MQEAGMSLLCVLNECDADLACSDRIGIRFSIHAGAGIAVALFGKDEVGAICPINERDVTIGSIGPNAILIGKDGDISHLGSRVRL